MYWTAYFSTPLALLALLAIGQRPPSARATWASLLGSSQHGSLASLKESNRVPKMKARVFLYLNMRSDIPSLLTDAALRLLEVVTMSSPH